MLSAFQNSSKKFHLLYTKRLVTYLSVSYKEKDLVKAIGARWDSQKKMWFVPSDIPLHSFYRWIHGTSTASGSKASTNFRNFLSTPDIFLNVPNEDFDEIKRLGAKWHESKEKWYISTDLSISESRKFDKWKRTYLNVPIEEKSSAKSKGAHWDPTFRLWYVPGELPLEPFSPWISGKFRQVRYLLVPFEEKDAVRELGAKWDGDLKRWCVMIDDSDVQSTRKFSRWIEPTYLEVPFSDRAKVLAVGGKWDNLVRKWYVPSDKNIELFKVWVRPAESKTSAIGSNHSVPVGKATKNSKPEQCNVDNSADDRVIILDVETTGLPTQIAGAKFGEFPDFKDMVKYDSARIVQITAMLCDRVSLREIQLLDFIIKAEDFQIPEMSTKIHGISQEISMTQGLPFTEAIRLHLAPMFKKANYILAHNANFDVNVIKAELFRYKLQDALLDFSVLNVSCTMKTTKAIVGATNSFGKIKDPKLKELYEFAMQKPITNEHNSKYDVMNLREVIEALVASKKVRLWE